MSCAYSCARRSGRTLTEARRNPNRARCWAMINRRRVATKSASAALTCAGIFLSARYFRSHIAVLCDRLIRVRPRKSRDQHVAPGMFAALRGNRDARGPLGPDCTASMSADLWWLRIVGGLFRVLNSNQSSDRHVPIVPGRRSNRMHSTGNCSISFTAIACELFSINSMQFSVLGKCGTCQQVVRFYRGVGNATRRAPPQKEQRRLLGL